MDFTTVARLPLVDEAAEAAHIELRPVFDPALRTFSVHLWVDGQPCGNHGLTDNFRYPDEPLHTIDDFLAERGVRALTQGEQALLYAGLLHAKGGPDWQLFQMHVAAAGGQA